MDKPFVKALCALVIGDGNGHLVFWWQFVADHGREPSPQLARLNGWRPTQSPSPSTIEVADLVNCY